MDEYSWTLGEELAGNEVPEECMPQRIALTATGVVTRRNGAGNGPEILLCNPHPDTWNNWLLPYGSLTLDPGQLTPGVTFGALAELMTTLREREEVPYEEKALAEVKKLAGMAGCAFTLESAMTNYSLKFSKSANVWTGYCFAYHVSRDGHSAVPRAQATWLSLDEVCLADAIQARAVDGLPVADNVLSLLSNQESLAILRS